MAKLLKIKGKPSALFFFIFSPTFALMPRVNATVFGPRQPLLALMINILWNHMSNYFVFKQESKERIAELLGIELKEEDFECIEDFPGKLHILPVRNKRAKRAFVWYECSLRSFVSSTPSSCGAWKRKIRGWIPCRRSDFFFFPCLWLNEWHYF